jgi:glycerophosphoryl diester phosphodiesterase
MHAVILSTRENGGVSTSRPEVVAHRGSSHLEPEHTLAAYLRAIDDGADALECDVRLTSDGTLVCVHDRRIDRTSHGSGSVSGRDIDELSEHDYSYRFWHDFEEPDNPERTQLLTLERLLTTALEKNPDIRFAIETKHPVRYGGYIERELADVLTRFSLDTPRRDGMPPVRMMSFSWLAVRRMQRLAPHVPTVFLMDRIWWPYRDGSLPPGVAAAGPSIDVVRRHPNYVQRVQATGGQVHVWTVDEKSDFDLCQEQGVDVMISNRPGRLLEWLDD